MIHYKAVIRLIGVLLILISLLQLLWIPASFIWGHEHLDSMVYSGFITLFVGTGLYFLEPGNKNNLGKREGYLIVTFGWIFMAFASTLPYIISGVTASFPDAFFEAVSGLTTTGATIFSDIESLPNCILYWRSMTQWIGGLGIIVLTVAIFPLLGIGGVELFIAEAPGPTNDKLHPRIKETARRLWLIYLGLTIGLALILYMSGMTSFDAINHAMTTLSTGGFSTKNNSIAAFEQPIIQYTLILFMFIAGTNFTLVYLGLKGKLTKVWNSSEFRFYMLFVSIIAIFISLFVFFETNLNYEESFRAGLFQVMSLVTTTGYITSDYTTWSGFVYMIFFLLLFSGASAGSTSGGIKLIRLNLFFKNAILEIRRLIHPNAYIRLKMDKQIISGKISSHIMIFIGVYLLLFVVGAIIMTAFGMDIETALGASATSISNVGPAIGQLGPMDNFSWIHPGAKIVLPILMILGRLEIFTILVLFSPYFWRVN
jgi:trk system potassium uptake protein